MRRPTLALPLAQRRHCLGIEPVAVIVEGPMCHSLDRGPWRLDPTSNLRLRDPMDVWVLWHVPPGGDERGEYMLIGVYSSRDAALAAVARLADQPGFRDNPDVTDDVDDAGFNIVPYALDQDHWAEGYISEP